jgi:hypothetical protein
MSDDSSYPSEGRIHSQFKHPVCHRESWRADFLTAAGFLAWMAAGISIWAIGVALLRRQLFFPEYGGVSIWRIIETYWIATLIGLLPLTLLMPLTRFRWGHGFVGFVLGFVFYFVIGWRILPHESNSVIAIMAIIMAFGMFGVGVVTFDDDHGAYLSPDARALRVTKLAICGLIIIGIIWAVLNPPICLFPTYCRR